MRTLNWVRGLATSMVAVLFGAGSAFAAGQGTQAEAGAMVKQAVAYINANGPEKAAQEITNGKTFKDRDLYVTFTGLDGKVLAHGGNPKLVGKNLTGHKDSEGNPFFEMLVTIAKEKGHGWSGSYRFLNPTTQKLEAKVMYVERVGDNWVGVGVYK